MRRKILYKSDFIALTVFELILALLAYFSYIGNRKITFMIFAALMLVFFLGWLSLIIIRLKYKNINTFFFYLPCIGNFDILVDWLYVKDFVITRDGIGVDFYQENEALYFKDLSEEQKIIYKQNKHLYGYGLILTEKENLEKLQSMKEHCIRNLQADLIDISRKLESDPSFNNYMYRVDIYNKLHDYNSALEDINYAYNIVSDQEELVDLLNQRSFVKECLGDFQGAMDDYNQLIELAQDDWYYYAYLAQLKVKLQDIEGAINDLKTAAEHAEDKNERKELYKKIAELSAGDTEYFTVYE